MVTMLENRIYEAFGLSIKSEVFLPELTQSSGFPLSSVDVEITIRHELPCSLNLLEENDRILVEDGSVIFRMQDIAIFMVSNGKSISITPLLQFNEDAARLILLGSCMGVVLLQRKVLPLHGSAIAVDGKCLIVIGDSGAGKSTLAKAFLTQGHQLLTDDVIGITFDDHHSPFVLPSYPQQKLWQESLDHFGIDNEPFRPLIQRVTKFAIPVQDQFYSKPLPLVGIFELVKSSNSEDEIVVQKIESLDRWHTLFKHTYRNFLITHLELSSWHFDLSTAIIEEALMYQITRPTTTFTAPEIVDSILTILDKGAK